MNERARAEEHLRVIRSLMERATIYRAISAPTALIGGLLAVVTASAIWWFNRSQAPAGAGLDNRLFAEIWLAILALVLAVNTFFVRQEALRDGRVLLSAGARLALRAIAPCLVLPAATTIWYFKDAQPIDQEILVAVWIAFYGLCLLATALFAPRSLVLLGWAFPPLRSAPHFLAEVVRRRSARALSQLCHGRDLWALSSRLRRLCLGEPAAGCA